MKKLTKNVRTILSVKKCNKNCPVPKLFISTKYDELFGTKKEEESHREATASNIDTTPITSENVPYTKSSSDNNLSQMSRIVNNETPTQQSDTFTPTYESLEEQSRNNEPVSAEDVKKVTGFGDRGTELVTNITNTEGTTFSQALKAVKNAYNAGFENVDASQVNFETETQINAFTAGKMDRLSQDTTQKVKSKTSIVYDDEVIDKSTTPLKNHLESDIIKENTNNASAEDAIHNGTTKVFTQADVSTVADAVKTTLKPEIISNTKLITMMQERFGDDGFRVLASDIISTYKRDGNIGKYEALFTDGARAIYDILNASENKDGSIYEMSYSLDEDYTNSNEERGSLKDVGDEGYSTKGTKWAIDNGLLTRNEQASFWETIANLSKRGYYVPKSKNGQYIVDVGQKLVFTNGDFKAARINSIIEFNGEYEANINGFKEWIIDEERNTAQHGESIQIIEIVQGEGYVGEHFPSAYRTDAREIRGREGADSRKINQTNTTEQIDYSYESEEANEQGRDILPDGSGQRKDGKSARQSAKKVDGRTSRYRESHANKRGRRRDCQALKDAGHTRKEIVYGHECEVIPSEHYNDRMRRLANRNAKEGIDETIIITGQAILPSKDGPNGISKKANGMFIRTKDGRKIIVVQYDNEFHMPEKINDHELIHNNYNSSRVQKVKNLILNSLSLVERRTILERLSKDYKGIIKGNEEKIFEEFIANTLSGMNEYTAQFNDLVRAYWAGDDAAIDSFKVSEYIESIDAGGENKYYSFPGGVFPPFDESQSDTNERATRWAHKKKIKTGAQRIFFYKGDAYLVEKFDSMDLGYLIIRKLSDSEVGKIDRYYDFEDDDTRYGTDKGIQSGREGTVSDSKKNQEGSEHTQRSGNDDLGFDRHNGETSDAQGIGRSQDEEWSFEYDRGGNNKRGVSNSQRQIGVLVEGAEIIYSTDTKTEDDKLLTDKRGRTFFVNFLSRTQKK